MAITCTRVFIYCTDCYRYLLQANLGQKRRSSTKNILVSCTGVPPAFRSPSGPHGSALEPDPFLEFEFYRLVDYMHTEAEFKEKHVVWDSL